MATVYGSLHEQSQARPLEADSAVPAAGILLAGLSAAAGIIHLAMVPRT